MTGNAFQLYRKQNYSIIPSFHLFSQWVLWRKLKFWYLPFIKADILKYFQIIFWGCDMGKLIGLILFQPLDHHTILSFLICTDFMPLQNRIKSFKWETFSHVLYVGNQKGASINQSCIEMPKSNWSSLIYTAHNIAAQKEVVKESWFMYSLSLPKQVFLSNLWFSNYVNDSFSTTLIYSKLHKM